MTTQHEDRRVVSVLNDKVEKLDQRFQLFEKETIERITRVETQVANIPELVYNKVKSILNEKSEGNFKWLANLMIPILTGGLGITVTYILTKAL